jgi:hypothetical protein
MRGPTDETNHPLRNVMKMRAPNWRLLVDSGIFMIGEINDVKFHIHGTSSY